MFICKLNQLKKSNKQNKLNEPMFQKLVGLFMLSLILLLPISSASAIAGTLTITKNSGQAGLNGFVNANDDTWTVEATVSNLQEGETVAAENLQIKVGNNNRNFNSCSTQESAAICQYLEPLTGGITLGAYTFEVLYMPTTTVPNLIPDEKSGQIRADGMAPIITFTQGDAKQEADKVKLSFTVSDSASSLSPAATTPSSPTSPSGTTSSSPCVGLAKINIFDADSGTLLLAKEDFPENFCELYKFNEDPKYNGYLPATWEGEGVRRLKIVAEDKLGHSTTSSIVSFLTDFVKPEVLELNFAELGKFLGTTETVSSLVVKIKEKSNLVLTTILATAPQTTLDKTAAKSCTRTKEDPNIWECTWEKIKIEPASSIAVTITAADAIGNTIETTLSQTFVTDGDAPVVEYFGPLLEHNGIGFVKKGQNPIVARIKEQGSGMSKVNVLAQLSSLTSSSASAFSGIKEPDECAQESELFICYWYTSTSSLTETSGDVRISLAKVADNAGNQASLPERDLIVDVTSPSLETLGIFGVSEGLAKNYFQSGDLLRVVATINEPNGLFWMIDLRNVVNDAETQFPATKINEAGWQTFKGEEVCKQNEEKSWDCTFETAAIKSGLVKNAFIVLKVRDAAGNFAENWLDAKNVEKRSGKTEEGKYAFDILAVKDEENPDYWSAGKAKPLLDFVDLDAMTFPQRIPIQISLKTDNPEVRALEINLNSCRPSEENPTPVSPITGSAVATLEAPASTETETSAFPEISRNIIYGNVFPDGTSEPKATIMLEFSPISDVRKFLGIKSEGEFKGVNIPYTCQLKVYSRLGNTALGNAETQDVVIEVPFAFSSLGSIDENLAQKVREMKESDFMKFANALEYINTGIAWINYVLNFMTVIRNVYEIISLFSTSTIAAANSLKKAGAIPGFAQLGATLSGACVALDYSQIGGWKTLEYVTLISQILSCNPTDIGKLNSEAGDDKSSFWGLGPYGWWQRIVLDTYNKWSGRDILGVPAKTPYENMYISGLSLCLPGIIYNIHKAREIQCRQIVCYGKEVPAGVATYDSCDKLHDLQMCEFWAGPVFDLPGLGAVAELGKILKGAGGANPLGLIKVTEIAACAALCWTDQTDGFVYYACKTTTGLNKLLNIINSIVSSIDNRPDIQGSPYCDIADTIDPDTLTGQTQLKMQ